MVNSLVDTSTLGGCLCLPEFELMYKTCFHSMDVIGLGDEGTQLPARIHYVIDEGDGKDLDAHDARPIAIMPKDWVTIQSRIQVSIPHISSIQTNFASNVIKSTFTDNRFPYLMIVLKKLSFTLLRTMCKKLRIIIHSKRGRTQLIQLTFPITIYLMLIPQKIMM
jgi:hypothetical protein